MLWLALLLTPASAEDYTVNDTVDRVNQGANGDCLTAAKTCSLRAAVQAAHDAGSGPHTIEVPAGYYSLSLVGGGGPEEGDLDLSGIALTITGEGADETIISAMGLEDRHLHVESSASLVLEGVTLIYGSGGAILNSGTLTVQDSELVLNEGFGGAIASYGSASLLRSRFSLNEGGAYGGAVYSQGGLVVSECDFEGNVAAQGGAIYSIDESLFIEHSTFIDNEARLGGGVYASMDTTFEIVGVTFAGNAALDGDSHGGGLDVAGARGTVDQSSFVFNIARLGGGIHIHDDDTVTVRDTTVGHNTALEGGGGIYLVEADSPVSLTHVTIARNEGGGLVTPTVAGERPASRLEVRNSLLVENGGGDCRAVLAWMSSTNLEDPSGCAIASQTDVDTGVSGIDTFAPELYWGWPHFRLDPKGPAMGVGEPADCTSIDQLLMLRDPKGCDRGAIEYVPTY